MPHHVGIARDLGRHGKVVAAQSAGIRAAPQLRKRPVGQQRQGEVVAKGQPAQNRSRIASDSTRILGDDARVHGKTQRRHRGDFARLTETPPPTAKTSVDELRSCDRRPSDTGSARRAVLRGDAGIGLRRRYAAHRQRQCPRSFAARRARWNRVRLPAAARWSWIARLLAASTPRATYVCACTRRTVPPLGSPLSMPTKSTANTVRHIAARLGELPAQYDFVDGYTWHFFASFDYYTSIERRMMFFRYRPELALGGIGARASARRARTARRAALCLRALRPHPRAAPARRKRAPLFVAGRTGQRAARGSARRLRRGQILPAGLPAPAALSRERIRRRRGPPWRACGPVCARRTRSPSGSFARSRRGSKPAICCVKSTMSSAGEGGRSILWLAGW